MAAKKANSKKVQRKATKPSKAAVKKSQPRKAQARATQASRPAPVKKKPVKKKKPVRAPVKSSTTAARKKVAAATKKPAVQKPVARKTAKAKPARKAAVRAGSTSNGVRRHDRAGHLDPHYAAQLRAKSLENRDAADAEPAFVKGARSSDDLAEELGEEAVETMTTGEDDGGEGRNQFVDEEIGGPFVESSGKTEFANDNDESNPDDATREPFPKS